MVSVPFAEMVRSADPTRREVRLPAVGYSPHHDSGLENIYLSVVREWWVFCRDVLAPAYTRPPPLLSDSDGRQLEWLLQQRDSWINSRIVYQTDTLRRWVTSLGTWHAGRFVRSVRNATGVRVDGFIRMGDVRDALEERIEWNVSLIRGLSGDVRRRVANVIFESFALRRTRREFLRELAAAMGVSQRQARNIARDQSDKIQAFLNEFWQRMLGFDEYIWRTMRDERVRVSHRAREGVRFRWDRPPADGHPGHPVNCRCLPEGYMRI